MNINTATAFILNNLLLVAAGGLLAAWFAWRMWQKVEQLVRSFPDWGALAFWVVKLVVVVAVLIAVGRWIYGTVNQAVIAAVNSPSIQTAGQGLVQLGGAVDQLVGWDGSSGASFLPTDISGAVNLLSPVTETSMSTNEAAAESASVPATLEFKPLQEMFVAAQVNMAAQVPANTEVGIYIVQGGDSLSAIAAKLGVPMDALCKANNLSNCNLLRRGQKLIVPSGGLIRLQADLQERVTRAVNQPAATNNQTVYRAPKLNQSYIPPTWSVIEEGQMSVAEPANMGGSDSQVFASFPTN